MSLSALWASVPELLDYPVVRGFAMPALEIRPEGVNPYGFPSMQPARGNVLVIDIADEAALTDLLARYARTEGHEALLGTLPSVGRVSHVLLNWPAPPSPESTPGTKAVRSMHEIAWRVDERWYLQPLLGDRPHAPTRLLIWWGLLLALSSLAR